MTEISEAIDNYDLISDEELFEMFKALGEESLYFFARYVIGNDYLTEEVHGELGQWLTSPDRKRVRIIGGQEYRGELMGVFIPRDCLKTTFVSKIYTLWRIIKNLNLRALIDSEARDLSMQALKTIKGYINECHLLRYFWGDLNGQKEGLTWNLEALRVKGRTDIQAGEETIETAGVDVAKTGRHFDLITMDDLHSERNTKSRDQIENIIEHIQLTMPLLDPKGTLILVGTFWGDDDAYQWLRELKDDNGDPIFDVFIRSSYNDDGSAYYPVRLPLDVLAMKKAIMTREGKPDLFASQYLLDPVPKVDIRFKESDINWITAQEIPPGLNRFMLADPIGDKKKDVGDKFAGATWAIDEYLDEMGMCKLYLINGTCGFFDIEKALDEIIALYMKTRPIEMGIEKAGMSTFDVHLKNRLKVKNLSMRFKELKPLKREKETRINQFVPYFKGGYVYVNKDADPTFLEEFLYEISRFPKAKRDDVLDASAYIFDFMKLYPPIGGKIKSPIRNPFGSTRNTWMGS